MRETYCATTTVLALCWSCFATLGAQGFLAPHARLPASGAGRGGASGRRCRAPRLAATPPGKPGGGGAGSSAAVGGSEDGAGFGADDQKRISRAPLRITPNFQPQEKRRPKTSVDRDITYGAFLTEESFDIAAMAWAEFSDWLRRTVERNVDGAQFEFDIRQWNSSIRKWWFRAVEMDVQAKADLFRLYERGMQERDAWGNHAVKVDARVEDEWDSIYVDCQDCFDSGSGGFASTAAAADREAIAQPLSFAGDSGMRNGEARSAVFSELSAYGMYQGEEGGDALGGGGGREGEEDEEDDDDSDGVEREGFDEEDIIDCAIRGRWTFKNNEDSPHFSPQ